LESIRWIRTDNWSIRFAKPVLTYSHQGRDGTTHVYFNPLDGGRLAALAPKPRVNLTRYQGVFAPNNKLRSQVALSGWGKRLPQAPTTAAERHQAMRSENPRVGGSIPPALSGLHALSPWPWRHAPECEIA
jgi:hypothetical protein